VSYEEAFGALSAGDYPRAVSLLEAAARQTDFSSDMINHAYTLALHHAGDKSRLAEVAFRVGNSLVSHDPASAMDYFQRALYAGLDAERVRNIGRLFESWAASNPPPPRPVTSSPIQRVAHVIGCLQPSDPRTHYLKLLVASLRKQRIESVVFTTESGASWFLNPDRVAQSQPVDIEADVRIASIDGDFAERANLIAESLRSSGIAVAFFHSNLAEQITARVASMRPVAIQVNVNHDVEMEADIFDGRIHLFQRAMQDSRFSHPAQCIPPASDIDVRLQMCEPITRLSMGLESAGSVSSTFGNLSQVSSREYLRVLTEILKRFPKHFHLFAGAGNVKAIRSHLHSEGVLPRVRFLGQVNDVAPMLEMIDVYFDAFPGGGAYSILDAMGAGKPVVGMRCDELVGVAELSASRESDYIEVADRLLRHSAFRAKQAQAVLDRFRAEFRPERLGERYRMFLQTNFPNTPPG
jgi:hypothetical protein